MPARPLFWLTVFFMLGISADRLFGESLPVQTHYFAVAALILIAAYGCHPVVSQPYRRTEGGSRSSIHPHHSLFTIHYSLLTNFAIPALLFVIFGMWAAKSRRPAISSGP